jgi:hypothetical protein
LTETAEEKTKRGFAETYLEYDWEFQTTIFIKDYPNRLRFIEDAKVMRRAIAKTYPKTAFLWRIILSRTDADNIESYDGDAASIRLPCLTLFHYIRIQREDLGDAMEHSLRKEHNGDYSELYIKGRSLGTAKYHSYPKKVKDEKPHNLKNYFNKERNPQRFGIIGEDYALKWTDSILRGKELEQLAKDNKYTPQYRRNDG